MLNLCLASAGLLIGCGSTWKKGEPWTFALTRDILARESNQPQYEDWDPADPSVSSLNYRKSVEELWILALFFLPTAIDVLLLPVTAAHDVYVD